MILPETDQADGRKKNMLRRDYVTFYIYLKNHKSRFGMSLSPSVTLHKKPEHHI